MHPELTIEGEDLLEEKTTRSGFADSGEGSTTLAEAVPGLSESGYWEPGESPYDHQEVPSSELGQSGLWAVPWSDLMMVMFVLFAALLAVQQTQHGSEPVEVPAPEVVTTPDPTPEPVVEFEERVEFEDRPTDVPRSGPSSQPLTQLDVLGQSEAAVREAGIENVEVALTKDQSVKVSVQGPMFFDLGKAELQPPILDFLDRLAEVIQDTPFEIDVVGHTDDYPVKTAEFPSNWELSLVRAARVARYLIERSGVHPGRFTAMGRSMYAPAVPNEDDESRALNRRVEIIITRRRSEHPE